MMAGKKFVPLMLWFASLVILIFIVMQPLEVFHFKEYIAVLFPQGSIAKQELHLLLIIQGIMLLVIVPVYVLTFIFSWKYRADNKKAIYDPDLVDNKIAEYIWWGLPTVLTIIVAVLTWIKTHELDPFKPIENGKKPLTIQVVALQWKWLFIYPSEKIACVNFLQFPKDTPIQFEITADAPMNSFWIPELSGQIYAMPSMRTEINLIANEIGDFRGSSANLSGEGFSEMHFTARASSQEDYQHWIETVKQSSSILNLDEYNQLAAPSLNNPVKNFQLGKENLFEQILHKYMHPREN